MTDLVATNSIRSRILSALGERCYNLLALLPDDRERTPEIYWARQRLQPTEVPAVVITPQPEEATPMSGVDEKTMPVQISMVCLLGDWKPVDLGEYLLAQMCQVIPGQDESFGGLCITINYLGGGVEDYPEDTDQAMVCTSTWAIVYETFTNNPFDKP
jgi:hypothetical protein